MKFIICSLLVALFCLLLFINTLKRKFKENKEKQKSIIDDQNKQISDLVKDNEKKQAQIEWCSSEIKDLKTVLEETKRSLDFYKNIEEDSSELNISNDNQKHDHLTDQVAQQLVKEQNSAMVISENNNTLKSDIELDSEQSFAQSKMENSSQNFFITGKAGSGKSFLLDVFRKSTKKSHIVLAPTGIAALNVGGVTIHSTFGYHNLVNLDIDNISSKTIRLKSEKRIILRHIETIIIDEISMVRADTLEKIDRILKVINQNEEPFGGKQMLLFGDLFQLPPIAKKPEEDYLYDRFGGIHFFCADAYKNSNFRFIELSINHRQKDDAKYFNLLNRIRDGNATEEDLNVLNSRVVNDISIYDRFTSLLPTKAEVEKLNRFHIEQLDSREYVYKARIVFEKYPDKNQNLENIFPISHQLRLKKGVLVMMVVNDPEGHWVNGTLGIVSKLTENSITVMIDKREFEVKLEKFTEQEITYQDNKIIYEDTLSVEQYPLVPAYAITIHKSQGQTYKNIVCDIERCFANGQAYVALSRCASLEGLHLKNKISSNSIRVDSNVVEFYRMQKIQSNTH